MALLYELNPVVAVSVVIVVVGFVAMISLTLWGVHDMRRGHVTLHHAVIQGQIALERGLVELQRGHVELQHGQAELKRLDIVIGGMVYQEDEKTRALIIARFDEMLRLLPR